MGLSFREISAVIPVAKGTLSGWCADITLTHEQQARLDQIRPHLTIRRHVGIMRRMDARARRAQIRSRGRQQASNFVCDPDWVAGVVAYWAEGCKGKELRFANSDPDMVKLFVRWSSQFFGLSPDRFAVALHLHSGQDEQERREFWSHVTGIPSRCFRKTFVKPEGTGHRKNVLYNGTASITVRRSGDLLLEVLGWIDALRDSLEGPVNFRRAASSTG